MLSGLGYYSRKGKYHYQKIYANNEAHSSQKSVVSPEEKLT